MKSLVRNVLIILTLSSFLFAQDLAESELRSVELGTVEFVNYEGPHERIDSLNQILDIGRSLSRGLSPDGRSSVAGKYRIERIFVADTPLLSADLFILGADAQVDHIVNLRRILAAYLSETYGYGFDDAELLAEFATYYNAVHRGEMEYFEGLYHPRVIGALDPAIAGLATVYSQWPGATQMLFPLSPGVDGNGAVDSDTLTDEQVVERLQQEEDKGVPERKEMTELREREVEEQQQEIDRARDEIAEEEEAIAREEQEIESDRRELEQQREEAAAVEDEEERQRQEEEIAARDEELSDREEAVEERQQAVEERREETDRAEEEVAERVENIREERERIAEDERSLIEERETEASVQVPFLYLENGLRRLVAGDSKSGRIVKRSGLNTIRSADLEILGDAYLVIAGETGGNRAVRLVTVDPESFEMRAQGDADVYPASFLLTDARRIFAVIDDDGYRVGRFDASLALQAASDAIVEPDTWLTLREGALYAQGPDGELVVLDPDNLSDITEQ